MARKLAVSAWLVEVYALAERSGLTDLEVAAAFASELGPLIRSMVRDRQERPVQVITDDPLDLSDTARRIADDYEARRAAQRNPTDDVNAR